ncbi:MAG: AAA family ATPase [Firmicutes bacterium]|nr:AAA family ATPase [Bacillota bacterium]MCL5038877.1 AAA family ATPase [Bacillota bacterium]
MKKEVILGVVLGSLAFLLWQGYNIWPLAFLAGLFYLLYQTTALRTLQKRFVAVDNKNTSLGVSFSDIGGQNTAINELVEALDFVNKIDQIKKLGIRPLKGLLLTGPPGTGKTMLAKAAANYTNSAFLATSGSEFIEVYAGVGAQRVRQVFHQARELAHQNNKKSAIVFIDEIEVLGGKRGQFNGHLEYDQTINQLLVEMDGLSLDEEIRLLVVGATNRADLLDQALLRPGRFDRLVRVDLPDREGRLQILKLQTRNKPLAEGVDLEEIARETFGFSGAHLESLANEAAILALRQEKEVITQENLREAIDKVIMGEKLERRPKEEEMRRIALHEAGHALAGEALRPGSVSSINVSSRGRALGYVRHSPLDDPFVYPREDLEEEIAILLGGAVAEEIVYGSRSTGSGNDFEKVVEVARRIIHLGMSDLGIVDPERLPQETFQKTLSDILKRQEERIHLLLEERRGLLEYLTQRLIEKESLSGEELRSLMREVA